MSGSQQDAHHHAGEEARLVSSRLSSRSRSARAIRSRVSWILARAPIANSGVAVICCCRDRSWAACSWSRSPNVSPTAALIAASGARWAGWRMMADARSLSTGESSAIESLVGK